MLYPQIVPKAIDKIFLSYTWRRTVSGQEVFLTFDDGPHLSITPWVLEQLRKYNFKATFFCVGDNVNKYPEIYAQILNEGHRVGNHTYNHLKGWKTECDEYITNIAKCRALVNSNLFRPPYGRITKSQTQLLHKEYEIIMWSLLTGDFYPNLNVAKALKILTKKTIPGHIVVFHDSLKAEKNLRALLPNYLSFLNAENYKSVVL
ncbi:MAG: polysaccharide deacetylase family protein [Bacteroidia bacterium]|nr:polysaccharide deacetylase family protein [Bacteroidia bacterium]